MNEVIIKLLKRFDSVKGTRHTFENKWQDINKYVTPHRGDFTIKREGGTSSVDNIYDSTAIQSNELLATTFLGGLLPAGSKWFELKLKDESIKDNHNVKMFLQESTSIMLDVFNSPDSNFTPQNHELFIDLIGYGTAAIYVDEVNGAIRFNTRHLSEIFILENSFGRVDTVFRKFKFTPRQAVQQWGAANVSKQLRKMLDDSPDTKLD